MNEAELALEALKFKIHQERGFNCHLYKDKCLRRRLAVRMTARGCDDFRDYSDLLDRDRVEYDRLIDTLTINVTKFFRNYPMWEILAEEVIPRLFDGEPGDGHVGVWSAGCASGEEAYSVSILMREWAEANGRGEELERVEILGTDIDLRCLEVARAASFDDLSLEETPPELRSRWFSAGPPYTLSGSVRERVRFERADIMSDRPPAGQRLILCRNVLIYLSRSAQEAALESFYHALAPGGYLVLGRVETLLGRPRSLFRPVSTRERIYQKPLA